MDLHTASRALHIVGFILLGGGLQARATATKDIHGYVEAAWYTTTFYDALVVPGSILVFLSGSLLIWQLGLVVWAEPWLAGMVGLFLFEFVEGNTVTRRQFRRTLQVSRQALATGKLTATTRREARTLIGRATHYLDLPLFLVIVYCGAARPDNWLPIIAAIALAVLAGASLTILLQRT